MTIFDEVKELVDVPTAARSYGVEVQRGNGTNGVCTALCPFHRERTPSMKLYTDHYYCFGCQAHGDVIKLVQELFGLKPIEAIKQINSDFALGLDVDKPPDMEAVNRRRREIAERKAEKARVEHMYDVLLRYFTLLDKYKMCYAPTSPDEETDRSGSVRFFVWLDYNYSTKDNDLMRKFCSIAYNGAYAADDWAGAWEEILSGTELEGLSIDEVWDRYAQSGFAYMSAYADAGEKSELLESFDIRQKADELAAR